MFYSTYNKLYKATDHEYTFLTLKQKFGTKKKKDLRSAYFSRLSITSHGLPQQEGVGWSVLSFRANKMLVSGAWVKFYSCQILKPLSSLHFSWKSLCDVLAFYFSCAQMQKFFSFFGGAQNVKLNPLLNFQVWHSQMHWAVLSNCEIELSTHLSVTAPFPNLNQNKFP